MTASPIPEREPPLVALVPAAGRAARLGLLPCSKEIFPLGFVDDRGERRARPACATLLESLRLAEVRRGYVLLRQGKWDIPALLGRGWGVEEAAADAADAANALHLAYLALEPTRSVPETLDRAYPFVADCRVALGFPDILFTPRHAFRSLIEHQDASGADAVLGLFPTSQPEKTDMVELAGDGRVRRLVIKDKAARLDYTWSIAVWGPRLSRYLHDFLARRPADDAGAELYVGNVLQAAIGDGLRIEGVRFPEGSYLDVGTPEDLERAMLGPAA